MNFTKISCALVLTVSIAAMVMTAGCEAPETITSPGTLSTSEQRALNIATERAIKQAGLDAAFLGEESLFIDVRGAAMGDLGKQHVASIIVPLIEQQGATISLDQKSTESTLVCYIRIAGVEREKKEKFERTSADVELGFQKRIHGDLIEKRGIGNVTIEKGDFFGPYEKIK